MDTMKYVKAAIGVGIVSWGLAWLYKMVSPGGIANITFAFTPIDVNVGKQIAAGVDTSIAGKLLSTLGGVIPSGIAPYVILFGAAFLVLLAGHWMNSSFVKFGKTPNSKFAADLTLGALGIGLVAGYASPTIGYLGAAIALGIYYFIVAMAYNGLRKFGASEFLPTID